jgi:hypothetical protein
LIYQRSDTSFGGRLYILLDRIYTEPPATYRALFSFSVSGL